MESSGYDLLGALCFLLYIIDYALHPVRGIFDDFIEMPLNNLDSSGSRLTYLPLFRC